MVFVNFLLGRFHLVFEGQYLANHLNDLLLKIARVKSGNG
jgi:hypothetical protein